MARTIKTSSYHTDFLPLWGLPLMVIHFCFIGAYYFAEIVLFPHIGPFWIKDALTGLLNPPMLVLSFYVSCLIYLFTREDDKTHFRLFSLTIFVIAALGTAFHIYLPGMMIPADFVPRFLVMLLGSGAGALTCVFYRHVFCGKIDPLL